LLLSGKNKEGITQVVRRQLVLPHQAARKVVGAHTTHTGCGEMAFGTLGHVQLLGLRLSRLYRILQRTPPLRRGLRRASRPALLLAKKYLVKKCQSKNRTGF